MAPPRRIDPTTRSPIPRSPIRPRDHNYGNAVRLTTPKPEQGDQPWMTVTCTPDTTSVEFFDEDHLARDAARLNLVPTTSVYVGEVKHQGEHVVRAASNHIAISVTITPEIRAAFRDYNGSKTRKDIANTLRAVLLAAVTDIVDRVKGRANTDDETTHSGKVPDEPR